MNAVDEGWVLKMLEAALNAKETAAA